MWESFLKPFGKAFILFFLPYSFAFPIQSDYLLRVYITALAAPPPTRSASPPPKPPGQSKTPTSLNTLTSSTAPVREWHFISMILIFSILSALQFQTVSEKFSVQAIVEAIRTVIKYVSCALLFLAVMGIVFQAVCPSKRFVQRTVDGYNVMEPKGGGTDMAGKQHPFLFLLLTLSMATFSLVTVASDTNHSLSMTVFGLTSPDITVMFGNVPLRNLIKTYSFFLVIIVLAMFTSIKYSLYKQEEVWMTNVFKNLGYSASALLGPLCSGLLIQIMLRFDFNRFDVAEHTRVVLDTAPYPSNTEKGKGIMIPESIPHKFPKPYYTLALSTWSMIRITILILCITTGFPSKDPYDACTLGTLVELPVMIVVILLFATMKGEGDMGCEEKAQTVVKERKSVAKGERIGHQERRRTNQERRLTPDRPLHGCKGKDTEGVWYLMSPPPCPNQPPIKVFGLGLGRTGTLSLCHALEKLGFGPCYHPLHVPKDKLKWVEWAQVLDGRTDPEFLDSILEGFHSAVDSPVAYVADSIYKAYPNAKYILTDRDPDKWEESIKTTFLDPFTGLLPLIEKAQNGTITDEYRQYLDSRIPNKQWAWIIASRSRYNLENLSKGIVRDKIINHNKWIKELIPPEQLLIFDVKEGWGPLVKFLGVESEPEEPFPRVNESAAFLSMAKAASES